MHQLPTGLWTLAGSLQIFLGHKFEFLDNLDLKLEEYQKFGWISPQESSKWYSEVSAFKV